MRTGTEALSILLVASACGTSSAGTVAPSVGPPADRMSPVPTQVTKDAEVRHAPTTEDWILKTLEETASEIPANAFAPRIALADVTYPRSQRELDAMGGFALVLVTAVSHESGELPIAKVEIVSGDRSANLVEVTARKSLMPEGKAARAFGRYRVDAIYLMPVFATRNPGIVTVFLGRGALRLRVLEFPISSPVRDGLDLNGDLQDPKRDALCKLVAEELPVIGTGGLSCR